MNGGRLIVLKYFSSTESFLRTVVWSGLALFAVIDLITLKIIGIELVYGEALKVIIFAFAFCLFAYVFYKSAIRCSLDGYKTSARVFKACSCIFESLSQFIVFTIFSAILAYIASASPMPFYDEQLLSIDRALGFDWFAYIKWVDKTAYADTVLSYSYFSFFQIPLLFILLSAYQKYIKLYSVMLCFIIGISICAAISFIFPAMSAYTFFNVNHNDYHNVNLLSGYWHIDDLLGMRNGTIKSIHLFTLKGIITFPSFHASTAIILLWGFWSIIWTRLPFFLLNMVMIASVPVTGGHYFVDVISGVIIAILAILLVKYIVKYANTKFETINI